MEIIHSNKIITVIRRSLNLIDKRLTEHGVKVMVVLQDMLKAEGCQDMELKNTLSLLALLHDVGAYRTEEIDDLVKFEIGDVWQHSIYGYLFLREFTPLGEWAKVVLYHHADCQETADQPEHIRRYAQMLHVADRAVVWHDEVKRSEDQLNKHFSLGMGTKFSPEAIRLWLKCQEYKTFEKLDDTRCLDAALGCCCLTDSEAADYLAMVIHAIDFRSRDTVTHTMGVMEIGLRLARRMNFPEDVCQKIYYGAMLHDLGKIGTPVSVLEKPGRLTPQETAIMQNHVVLSRQIIDGCVDKTVSRIALRHHEKLDGSGYPLGLKGEDLTLPERLLTTADIVSALCMSRSYKEAFSKQKCLSILRDMQENGKLDPQVVTAMETFFDEIMSQADEACRPLRETYGRVSGEYQDILKKFYPASLSFTINLPKINL